MSSISVSARRELRSVVRSGAFKWSVASLWLLLAVAAMAGIARHERESAQRQSHQALVDKQWAEQPDRHPHRVAHYGSFAFRPRPPLAAFDPGLDPYTGTSVFLEAHRQNSANFGEARHATGLLRFGELSPALIIQIFLPLLIIALAFSSVTSERESGNLRLLLSHGLSSGRLVAGKTLGQFGAVLLAAAPALILPLFLAVGAQAAEKQAGLLERAFWLTAGESVYLFTWVFGCVLVSALCRRSRDSLLSLLVIWAVLCLVLPRTLPALAAHFHPASTKAEFDAAMRRTLAEGVDGHDMKDERARIFREQVLAEHGVQREEDLPFNFHGLTMKKGEEHGMEVFRKTYGELLSVYSRQNRYSSFASLANPYLGMRNLSMALSGTDLAHFVDFNLQAENHRYVLIQGLNDLHMHEIKWKNDKLQRVSSEHWKGFPVFAYKAPGPGETLRANGLEALSLAAWPLLLLLTARIFRFRIGDPAKG